MKINQYITTVYFYIFFLISSCAYNNYPARRYSFNREVIDVAKSFLIKKSLIKDIVLPKTAARIGELKDFELLGKLEKEDWIIFCPFRNNPIDLYRAYIVVIDSLGKTVKYSSYCYQSSWSWKWICKE